MEEMLERQTDFSYLEQTYRELIKREEGISEEYLRILYDDPYKSLKSKFNEKCAGE